MEVLVLPLLLLVLVLLMLVVAVVEARAVGELLVEVEVGAVLAVRVHQAQSILVEAEAAVLHLLAVMEVLAL